MQIGTSRTRVGLAALAVVCLLWAAPQAHAQKAKSTQTEATWVEFDAEKNTVTVRVRKPGKGATPPRHLKLRKGREATFNVKPTGSVLTRTSVAINGKRGELADIPTGKRVNIYWIPDPDDDQSRFARKIDLFIPAEEQGEAAD
jgi:hypothetical protein